MNKTSDLKPKPQKEVSNIEILKRREELALQLTKMRWVIAPKQK